MTYLQVSHRGGPVADVRCLPSETVQSGARIFNPCVCMTPIGNTHGLEIRATCQCSPDEPLVRLQALILGMPNLEFTMFLDCVRDFQPQFLDLRAH
jgi:hypothetical protein